jgi:hypothetical protein
MNLLPSHSLRRTIAAMATTSWLLAPALGQVYQLTINDSNPAAVVISTTGQNAIGSDASTADTVGFSLLSFFTSPGLNLLSASSSTLKSPTGRFYSAVNGDDSNPLTSNLRVFAEGVPGQAQGFSSSAAAFQGSMVVDFSSIASRLPSLGTTGTIIANWSGSPGVTLGQWVVIPEPETYGLAVGAGLVALALWRRPSR